jgi:hypothetical protein
MQSYDQEAVEFTQIQYYKDDDHFILKLTPKDRQHEIQLAKGIGNESTLLAAVRQTSDLIKLGNKERKSTNTSWKYILNDIDMFAIPVIKFNIENNYEDIEGQVFTTNGKRHHVETAYQRTGFIFDENGAVVESEAYSMTDSSFGEPTKIPPKKLVLDKAFFIIIKRTLSDNPYFVMYVANVELMTKE